MTDKLPPKIFVVESDDLLRTSLCNTIERYWFNVFRAGNFETSLRLIDINQPNLIIISSRMQGISALDLAKKIKELNSSVNVPIIFLIDDTEAESNYKTENDHLVEVLFRPYTPNEIMTTIKALLRKSKPTFQDKIIKYKKLSMDLATYKVMQGNKQIHLGPTEFKILQLLVQAPKTIFSRQQIIDYVWGTDQKVETRTVDVHVNRLRTLIKQGENDLPFIKTVRAAGYCLNLPGEID